ncbi:radical SAM protein [Tenacibaculum maritimum]|uniref:radical SAM protein n=1 Tax=Tenacibaculum maritimum TaxID=107401 RepID=UPI0038769038
MKKYSQFNTMIPHEDKYVFYNAYANKFLYLEPLLKDLIEASKSENELEGLGEIHPDLYVALNNLGFIIDEEVDEIEKVRKLITTIDHNEEEYYLIINPTMNCNFKCYYCYESHIKSSKVSDKNLEKIKRFIGNTIDANKKLKLFTIQFFGGEPLLFFDKTILPIMEYVYQKTKETGVKLNLNFTTNAYLVNDEMIRLFKRYEVNSLQITLDGNREMHNQVRFVNKSRGSYDEIVTNMKKLVKSGIHVTFRINYTEKNLKELHDIFEDFEDLEKEERARLMLSMNKVWEEANENLGEEVVKFKERAEVFGFRLPDAVFSDRVRHSCYADKLNQATINYNGDVFKCNARDFHKDHREGVLTESGHIEWNEKQSIRMNAKLKNSSCLACKILPICGGGCSQQAIEYSHVDYCVNHYDEKKKEDIVRSMFLSKFLEKVPS